jgi:hypothetical protein
VDVLDSEPMPKCAFVPRRAHAAQSCPLLVTECAIVPGPATVVSPSRRCRPRRLSEDRERGCQDAVIVPARAGGKKPQAYEWPMAGMGICLGRMNNWGHAAFNADKLAELGCGKDSPSNRDMINRSLIRLEDMSRIMPLIDKRQYATLRRYQSRYSPTWRGHQKDVWTPEAADVEPTIVEHTEKHIAVCPVCEPRLRAFEDSEQVWADHSAALVRQTKT